MWRLVLNVEMFPTFLIVVGNEFQREAPEKDKLVSKMFRRCRGMQKFNREFEYLDL